MKRLSELRDEKAEQWFKNNGWAPTEGRVIPWLAGWSDCQAEMMKVVEELREALKFYDQWYSRVKSFNAKLRAQGAYGSFGHVKHDVDIALREALAKLLELEGE